MADESLIRETVIIDGRDETGPAVQAAQRHIDGFTSKVKALGKATISMPITILDKATAPLRAITRLAGPVRSALGGIVSMAAGFALGQGLYNLPGALMDMAKAAAEDAAGVVKLQQAVANAGLSWDKYGGALDATINKGMRLGFTDDQSRDALSLLIAQTGSATEAQKRYGLAMDLARGANIDVVTASKLLGKVTDENVNVLARYGIHVRKGAKEAELFAAVNKKFGGQAGAFANTAEGQMLALSIAMGELRESIGYIVLPIMTKLAGFALDVLVPALQDNLVPALQSIADTLSGPLSAAWAILQPIFAGAADGARALYAALTGESGALGIVGDLLEKAFGPTAANMIRPFLGVFMGAIDEVTDIVGNFKALLGGREDLGTFLRGSLLNGLLGIGGDLIVTFRTAGTRLLAYLRTTVPRWAHAAYDWIRLQALPAIRRALPVIIEAIRTWATGAVGTITQTFQGWADAAIAWVWNVADSLGLGGPVGAAMSWMSGAWADIKAAASDALTWISGTAWPAVQSAAATALGWASDTAWPAIKDAASTALDWISTTGWPAVSGAASTALGWAKDTAWPAIKLAAMDALTWVSDTGWPAVQAAAQPALDWVMGTAWPAIKTGAQDALNWAILVGWPAVKNSANDAFTWIHDTGWPMVAKGATDALATSKQFMIDFQGNLLEMNVPAEVQQGWQNVKDIWQALSDLFGPIIDGFNRLTDATSKSTTPGERAAAYIERIAAGFRDATGYILGAIKALTSLGTFLDSHPLISGLLTGDITASFRGVQAAAQQATTGSLGPPALPDPTAPGAASGVIVTRPTRLWVGEGGETEGVFPLSQMGRFGLGGGGDIHVTLERGAVPISIPVEAGTTPEAAERLAERIGDHVASHIARKLQPMLATSTGGPW